MSSLAVADADTLTWPIWGNQTAGAVSDVLVVADVPGPITNLDQWLLLMKKTAEKAFGTQVQ